MTLLDPVHPIAWTRRLTLLPALAAVEFVLWVAVMLAIWTVEPVLAVLVTVTALLPWFSRLRREPVILVVLQVVSLVLLVFVLWPLAQVTIAAFQGSDGGTATIVGVADLLAAPLVHRAVIGTLVVAVITAIVATVVGTLIAFALTLGSLPGRRILRVLMVLPLVAPPFVVGFAIVLLFGRRGLITYDLLDIRGWELYGAHGIVLVQVVSFLPITVLIVSAALMGVDRELELAAEDLGSRPLRGLLTVTLPLVAPAILASALLTFINSISDFGNPMLVGGGFQVLAAQAYTQINERFDLQAGTTLALLLMIPAMGAFILQHRITRDRSYVTVTSGARAGRVRRLPRWMRLGLFALCVSIAAINVLIYGSVVVGAFVRHWGLDHTLTLDNFAGLSRALPALWNSVTASVGAGILGGLLGVLLAWLVTRGQFRGRRTLDLAGTLLYAVPGTVIGIGYVIAFNAAPFFWTGTMAIIVVCFAMRSLPVSLRASIAAQRQVDPALEEASLDLGASRFRTFRQVTLPLVNRAFVAGVIFIFISSMTDLSAAIFVSGVRTQLYTVHMFREITGGSPSQAAALAVVLIAIVLASLALLARLTGRASVDPYSA